MKKFKKDEIFYNITKTHPKVKFFANGGQIFVPDIFSSGIVIHDLPAEPIPETIDLLAPPIFYLTFDGALDSDIIVPNIVNPGTYDFTTVGYGDIIPTTGISEEGISTEILGDVGPHTQNDAAFQISEFTLAFWLKISLLPTDDHFQVIQYNPELNSLSWSGWSVHLTLAGALVFNVGNNTPFGGYSAVCTTPTNVFEDFAWHHVAINRIGDVARIFINGEEVASGSSSIGFESLLTADPRRDIKLFTDVMAGTFMDEVIFCGPGVTDEEISNIYTRGLAGQTVTWVP